MKANVLGLAGTSLVLSLVAAPTAFAAETTAAPTAARPYQAAVVSLVSAMEASKMGRDLRVNPDPQRAGPGTEQAVISTAVVDGKTHVVVVYMASADRELQPQRAHMTLECASIVLSEDAPPEVLVRRKVIQAEEGRRTAHHPALSPADAKGRMLVTFGNDVNQNNPSAHAMLISHRCEKLTPTIKYSIPNAIGGSNDGGSSRPILMTPGANGKVRFLANYLATNGDIGAIVNGDIDDDYVAVQEIQVDDSIPGAPVLRAEWSDKSDTDVILYDADGDPATPETIELPAKTTPVPIATPTDIGRPHHRDVGDGRRFVLCTSKGQNRPSNHITCAVAEYSTGRILWSDEVLRGSQQQMTYWNQVTLDNLGQNRFVVHAIKSNGGGKNTNIKGINESLSTVFELNGDALVKVAELKNPAVHQTHSSVCSTMRGVIGSEKPTIAVISQPHTGVGRPGLTFVSFDETAKTLTYNERRDRVPTAFFGDSQLLSNHLGENPMQQGRNYASCLPVANPGWGKGFMGDVHTFVMTTINGREPGSERNGLDISFVPAVTRTEVDSFTNPTLATEVASTPGGETTTPPTPPKSGDPGGCACSTPGQKTGSSNVAGIVLLGLALGGIAARRRA